MRRNFTLVEVLAVIAIITILAGLSVGLYGLVTRRNQVAQTEALITRVGAACEQFRRQYGFYPPTMDGNVFRLDLYPKTATGGEAFEEEQINFFLNALGEEMRGRSRRQMKLGGNTVEILVDAWGNPLYYASPGNRNQQSFDLASAGPDGKVDGKEFWKLTLSDGEITAIEVDSDLSSQNMNTEEEDDIGNF